MPRPVVGLDDEFSPCRGLEDVWELILEWARYLWELVAALFQYDPQGRPRVDPTKKDDDLWSPSYHHHQHGAGAHGFGSPPHAAGPRYMSEADFLSHFLPAPGNHPALPPSSSQYRPPQLTLQPLGSGDPYASRRPGLGPPPQPSPAPSPGYAPSPRQHQQPPPPLPMFNQYSPYKPAAPHLLPGRGGPPLRTESLPVAGQFAASPRPAARPPSVPQSPSQPRFPAAPQPITGGEVPQSPQAGGGGLAGHLSLPADFDIETGVSPEPSPIRRSASGQPPHLLPMPGIAEGSPLPSARPLNLGSSLQGSTASGENAVDWSGEGVASAAEQAAAEAAQAEEGEESEGIGGGQWAVGEGRNIGGKQQQQQQALLTPEERRASLGVPFASSFTRPDTSKPPTLPEALLSPSWTAAAQEPAAAAAPHPHVPQPGRRRAPVTHEVDFDELTFGALVGEGGFGKVYYGQYRGQQVAIKLLSSEATRHSNVVEEFRREVVVMASLPEHPNVLRLIGACTTPPNLAMVTHYCERGSLYAMLHSPSLQLSWSQVIYLCLGAARGMAHLHSAYVLHRDLKSGNLLVDGSFCVKVADFGLSRVIADVTTLTGGLGTYQWMAPEVLAHQRYSQKADVYSFSIVLWECTARQVPYAGLNGMQAALAVMNRGLRPDIPPHTPAPLAALIRACWAAIPDQRPTFPEIVDRLLAMYDAVRNFRWEPQGMPLPG